MNLRTDLVKMMFYNELNLPSFDKNALVWIWLSYC